MADKKKTSVRDDIESALEYAPSAGATAGLTLGALAGMRSIVGRKTMRAFKRAERGEKLTKTDIDLLNRADGRMLPSSIVGGTAGGIAGGYAGSEAQSTFSKRRK